MRGSMALFAALTLLGWAPAQASESAESSGWESANRIGRGAFDLVLLRPLQLVQVVAHVAVFVPAYPMSLPFGGGEDVLDLCITEPIARFTRPLGEL